MTERPRYLTLKEAGELARTPPETVRKWIWQGRLKAFKPGRNVLVREADIIELIESNVVATQEAKS